MILSFKAEFEAKIRAGTKIHTIREDASGRWRPGRKIHADVHVRTKRQRRIFEGECKAVQPVFLDPVTRTILIAKDGLEKSFIQSPFTQLQLAQNDGFASLDDFWAWFDKPFRGKLIHWTGFTY